MKIQNSTNTNRIPLKEIERMDPTKKKMGRNLASGDINSEKSNKKVQIKDKIELKEKVWIHTENWLG
jgi:hypothetical protein